MAMQTLQPGTTLQGGKYIIRRVLGQGGFGITYLAEHTKLGTLVTIKEFFMKDFCHREVTTSHVSVSSEGGREQVLRFREKFQKEARNIAKLHHPNIVRISDVFEENGTAYYVMDYCEGGSLANLLTLNPKGISEALALKYIRQVASALAYIHGRKMNHLDVKPANILLDEHGDAVLIDFGLAKQYDSSGNQTSTTPVGISHGYAPIEQYKQGGVSEFSPSTDIYSLGATLYKLITGLTPPDAQSLLDDNLPTFSATDAVAKAIHQAMQPRRADRPQNVDAWLKILDSRSETSSVMFDSTVQTTTELLSKEPETPRSEEKVTTVQVEEQSQQKRRKKTDRKAKESEEKKEVIQAKVKEDVRHDAEDVEQKLHTGNKKQTKQSRTRYGIYILVGLLIIVISVIFSSIDSNSNSSGPIINKPHVQDRKNTNGYECVDLGLSSGTCWASKNIGAFNSRSMGNHYGWGETKIKTQYVERNHYYKSSLNPLPQMNDAASVTWGGEWKIPSTEQWKEIQNQCSWTWDGKGYIVTGPNGNSIYLPAAGYMKETSVYKEGIQGDYWSSTPYGEEKAYEFYFDANNKRVQADKRHYGASVRPVIK